MSGSFRILVIGGYGQFGHRICRTLCADPRYEIVLAGRDKQKAENAIAEFQASHQITAISIDHTRTDLSERLSELEIELVIHTGGPYQVQDYHVAEACIDSGAHYIDLSDARDFVVNFGQLHDRAAAAGVYLITGASTLPGVSSAVVKHLARGLKRLTAIEISIAPAQKTPRGLATVNAVLGYCGSSFRSLEGGVWKTFTGWQHLRRIDYNGIRARWGSRCDVPDLELLPREYDDVADVSFYAALGSGVLQWGMWFLAVLVRAGLVTQPMRLAPVLKRWSDRFDILGNETGAMKVVVRGNDTNDDEVIREWHLTAGSNHGPEIPCSPAIVLAGKLARGEISNYGAVACVNLVSLDEIESVLADYDISYQVEERAA